MSGILFSTEPFISLVIKNLDQNSVNSGSATVMYWNGRIIKKFTFFFILGDFRRLNLSTITIISFVVKKNFL
jgi:hypothetical protein